MTEHEKRIREALEAGKTYVVSYPFVLQQVEVPSDDPDSFGMMEITSWCPGIRWESFDASCEGDAVADGLGEMHLTVVDVHKPGRYPTRVFYTRQWKDPIGNVFGKGGLRIATEEKFRRLARGYKHDFIMNGGVDA